MRSKPVEKALPPDRAIESARLRMGLPFRDAELIAEELSNEMAWVEQLKSMTKSPVEEKELSRLTGKCSSATVLQIQKQNRTHRAIADVSKVGMSQVGVSYPPQNFSVVLTRCLSSPTNAMRASVAKTGTGRQMCGFTKHFIAEDLTSCRFKASRNPASYSSSRVMSLGQFHRIYGDYEVVSHLIKKRKLETLIGLNCASSDEQKLTAEASSFSANAEGFHPTDPTSDYGLKSKKKSFPAPLTSPSPSSGSSDKADVTTDNSTVYFPQMTVQLNTNPSYRRLMIDPLISIHTTTYLSRVLTSSTSGLGPPSPISPRFPLTTANPAVETNSKTPSADIKKSTLSIGSIQARKAIPPRPAQELINDKSDESHPQLLQMCPLHLPSTAACRLSVSTFISPLKPDRPISVPNCCCCSNPALYATIWAKELQAHFHQCHSSKVEAIEHACFALATKSLRTGLRAIDFFKGVQWTDVLKGNFTSFLYSPHIPSCQVCKGLTYVPYSFVEVYLTRQFPTIESYLQQLALPVSTDCYGDPSGIAICLVARNNLHEWLICYTLQLLNRDIFWRVFAVCSVNILPFHRLSVKKSMTDSRRSSILAAPPGNLHTVKRRKRDARESDLSSEPTTKHSAPTPETLSVSTENVDASVASPKPQFQCRQHNLLTVPLETYKWVLPPDPKQFVDPMNSTPYCLLARPALLTHLEFSPHDTLLKQLLMDQLPKTCWAWLKQQREIQNTLKSQSPHPK